MLLTAGLSLQTSFLFLGSVSITFFVLLLANGLDALWTKAQVCKGADRTVSMEMGSSEGGQASCQSPGCCCGDDFCSNALWRVKVYNNNLT